MKNIFTVIFVFIITTSAIKVNGQCNDFHIYDFSNGKGFTRRTDFNFFAKDYKEILKKRKFFYGKEMDIDEIKKDEISNFKHNYFQFSKPETSFSFSENINFFKNGNFQERGSAFTQLMLHNKQDTVFQLLKSYIVSGYSSSRKINYIKKLRFFNNAKSIPVLIEACDDSCIYVRLEAGFELSYRNENVISYKTLSDIWKINNQYINLDKFEYFTVGMRNIANPEALDFLYMLSKHKNPYCALDASICLLQLKMKYEGMEGLKYVLDSGNFLLIKSAIYSMMEYFSKEEVISHLIILSESKDIKVADFSQSMLDLLND